MNQQGAFDVQGRWISERERRRQEADRHLRLRQPPAPQLLDRNSRHQRLDIENRRPIQHIDAADVQLAPFAPKQFDNRQPNRIRTPRRPRRKHSMRPIIGRGRPQQLEAILLSRNAGNIGQVTNRFTTVYQAIPPSTDAPPAVRDLIDMTDATAQAAFKKAIAIDDAADQLMDAADQLAAELAVAAPGTAPMIEAQSAAMLVKAHALTQSATAELFRIRAIDMANTGASLKFNANHASDTRRDVTNMFKK